MAPTHVPDGGLALSSPRPYDHLHKDGSKNIQIMQLDLEDGMLHEMIKSIRHGGKGPQLSFGKTIVCRFLLNNTIHIQNNRLTT